MRKYNHKLFSVPLGNGNTLRLSNITLTRVRDSVLKIEAHLENLTDLQPQGGCDHLNSNFFFFFFMVVNCGRCGEVTSKEACLCLNDAVPLLSNKGTCHLVMKCKFCSREATMTMATGWRPLTQIESEFGHFTSVMVFDCRNVERLDFAFGSAEPREGTKYEVDWTVLNITRRESTH